MDKNAIKKYAVWARKELIARVSQKAEQYGITEQAVLDEQAENIHGLVLTPVQVKQRQALIALIRQNGYSQAMEGVAYTWFNRFIALRFMEVNNYLPGHTRAFTDEQNAFKPQILSDALSLELNGLDIDRVIELKEAHKTEELYQYLLITLCNHLSGMLPGMFQKIDDYTELLFPEHLLREGSVLEQLVSSIPEEDWTDAVQIIGWLYQYYNSELKDETFVLLKKNVKITKERIPAATQLFTPDWIVRYMVENSLGRLWYEGHKDFDKSEWKYYLDEAEQEPEVEAQLQKIRADYAQINPEEIKVIDPCMGSGHILVYAFDVLMQIYTSAGWSERDAARAIIENNLYGLDIDDRTGQLAYFAVMMKARKYNRRILNGEVKPNVYSLRASTNIDTDDLFCYGPLKLKATELYASFVDAKEFGSIIKLNLTVDDLIQIKAKGAEILEKAETEQLLDQAAIDRSAVAAIEELLPQAMLLAQKYDVVVTNPPYMGSSGMSERLATFLKNKYPDSKSDLFAVMMERCFDMLKLSGLESMITMESWMFLSSFERLRSIICNQKTILTLVHMPYLGKGGTSLGINFGTEMAVIQNTPIRKYIGTYDRIAYFETNEEGIPFGFPVKNAYYKQTQQDNFSKIPGAPVAYWVSEAMFNAFTRGIIMQRIATPRQGMSTCDVNRFSRLWFEVSIKKTNIGLRNNHSGWITYNKGGNYRKWYGNKEYLVWWGYDGSDLIRAGALLRNREVYFDTFIAWTKISSGGTGFRIFDRENLFDGAGGSLFINDDNYQSTFVLALLNTKVTEKVLNIISPTLNFNEAHIGAIPVLGEPNDQGINKLAKECISLSRTDWDSFETSWDFQRHPLVRHKPDDLSKHIVYMNDGTVCEELSPSGTLEEAYNGWCIECERRFTQLKANEEELNRIFIDIYGLQDELTPEVEDKDVTVRKADLGRDIRSLISYAVGCMLGRYSLDKPGLAFAGGEWDASQYETYPADKDGILPITDDEYFDDDIVGMFVNWVKTVYGAETLEENLKFIASAIYPTGSGTARELIRQYFLNDFYKDHLKIYQKRPIYWMFDAGKQNSFKCLIYLHRYSPATVARVRTDYVHEMQSRYISTIEELTRRVNGASGSERVRLQKQMNKVQDQAVELRKYEEKIHHYADMMMPLDLDDGVKVNYAKLQDVLAPIK